MNMELAKSANEMLISEIVGFISELVPIRVDEIKSKLSHIMMKYHINYVERVKAHPDLKEKIELFLSAKKLEGASKHTLSNYGLTLNNFAEKVKKKVENITSADIRVYLASFENNKQSTIGTKLTILKSFFGWLYGEEIIQHDPTRKLKPPKVERRLPNALTIEELEMLREGCQTPRQRALVEVLYVTGCRLSEVYDMNISDINVQTMSALVVGKGNKQREVYFSFKSLYHLNKYLNSRDDDCEALFITERKPHRRLSRRGIQREIKKIAANVGLEDKVSPHTLRRTFATLTLNNGAELAAVQELLGHSSPETTLRYARITEERKREQHRKYLVL